MAQYVRNVQCGQVQTMRPALVYMARALALKALGPGFGTNGFDDIQVRVVARGGPFIFGPCGWPGGLMPDEPIQSFHITAHLYGAAGQMPPRKALSVHFKSGYEAATLHVHGTNEAQVQAVFGKLHAFLLCVAGPKPWWQAPRTQ